MSLSRESPWSGWATASVHTLLTALEVSLSPHGTWGLAVYSQTAVPVLQLLAFGGPFLLLWLMDATAASLALVAVRRGAAARPLALALGATVALAHLRPGEAWRRAGEGGCAEPGLRCPKADGSPSR